MASMLRISDAASLGLHTMVLLAAHEGKVIATGEIASVLHVSEAHLSKVLQRLDKTGLVRSVRGPRGGFALAKSGRAITLLEVYEAIEGPLVATECLLGSPVCGRNCILGGLLDGVNRQVKDYFAGTSLASLVNSYRNVRVNTGER